MMSQWLKIKAKCLIWRENPNNFDFWHFGGKIQMILTFDILTEEFKLFWFLTFCGKNWNILTLDILAEKFKLFFLLSIWRKKFLLFWLTTFWRKNSNYLQFWRFGWKIQIILFLTFLQENSYKFLLASLAKL